MQRYLHFLNLSSCYHWSLVLEELLDGNLNAVFIHYFDLLKTVRFKRSYEQRHLLALIITQHEAPNKFWKKNSFIWLKSCLCTFNKLCTFTDHVKNSHFHIYFNSHGLKNFHFIEEATETHEIDKQQLGKWTAFSPILLKFNWILFLLSSHKLHWHSIIKQELTHII